MMCKVLSHRHPDVLPGSEGEITGEMNCPKDGEPGFIVKIDGLFLVAGDDRGKPIHDVKELWFPKTEIQVTGFSV